jgi:hypothetical protein
MGHPHLCQISQSGAIEGDLNLDLGYEKIFVSGSPRYLDIQPFNYHVLGTTFTTADVLWHYRIARVNPVFTNQKMYTRTIHSLALDIRTHKAIQ